MITNFISMGSKMQFSTIIINGKKPNLLHKNGSFFMPTVTYKYGR